jgi:small ligand-binding sensory domain FIST
MDLAAGSGLGESENWQQALDQALDGALAPLAGHPPDLLLLFASAAFAPQFSELLHATLERSQARELAGCSASGVIAGDRELEDEPAIAALALRLPPDATLCVGDDELNELTQCTGIVVLADPFTTDIGALIQGLQRVHPGVAIVGGMATGAVGVQRTHVFRGTSASAGAVVIGFGGSVGVKPIVSQGCEPIGRPWTITDVDGHIVRSIGNRPTYEVLVETIQQLEPTQRQRAARNLLVGLAMDEYRDEFKRGDFLIRNVLGVEQSSGAMAIGAEPRLGQTLQFQIRDARAADEELRHMLGDVGGSEPSTTAALLFACNGRGAGLFGAPDHDARTVRELLGPLPLVGLFCNGEIGPVGRNTFIHGFTASLGLIAPLA